VSSHILVVDQLGISFIDTFELSSEAENPKDLAVTFHSEFEALIPSSFASHLA
jgi:hypothetical protein